MANTEIQNNNPEKEPISDKSITEEKTKAIIRKNTTQNKKVFSTNKKKISQLMKFLMRFSRILL